MHITIDARAFLSSWAEMVSRMDNNGAIAWRNAVKRAYESQIENGYQNKTGALTASMKWKTWEPSLFGWRGELLTTAPHAQWVDSGTKPHKIPGPGRGPSRFYWPKVGHWVTFTDMKPAKHPGFKGALFTAEAIQRFGQSITVDIEKAFAAAAR